MKKLFSILIVFSALFSTAQDIHFSQYFHSPIYLNPANCGLFGGNYRFVGNYRNQWASVSTPYVTFAGSMDFNTYSTENYKISSGILFTNDKAGDGEFGTTQVGFASAFHKPINNDANQLLSVGLNINYYQNSINYFNLHFDNQYTGELFDPGADTKENIPLSSLHYVDFGMGLNWQLNIDDIKYYNVGISLSHINKPKKSFFDNNEIELDRKFTFYSNNMFSLSDNLGIIPGIKYSRQGKFVETIVGTSFSFTSKLNSKIKNSVFYIGPYIRLNTFPHYADDLLDAVILTTKLDKDNLRIGISYDVNISGLVPASLNRGGLELAIIYLITSPSSKKSKVNYQMCPVFL